MALSALLVITGLDCLTAASGQDYPDIPGYVPGTPPWVPLIDQCMSAGGQRNDCIEALPPDIYADFLAAERARAAERAALLQLPRTPRVPSAQDLPEIYQTPALLPELPAGLAGALTDSGCLIPKSLDGNSNVVFAELAATGQEDIAVICSVDGVSRIQIFWGGPASCPPIDNSSPDWALLYRTVD